MVVCGRLCADDTGVCRGHQQVVLVWECVRRVGENTDTIIIQRRRALRSIPEPHQAAKELDTRAARQRYKQTNTMFVSP